MNKKRTVKPKALKPSNRLFLVVADDSKELHQALYYAARRAATAGGEIALFRCIEPVEGQLWGGVSEIMEAETEQASKTLLEELSNYCEKLGAPKPRIFVRKGTVHEELFRDSVEVFLCFYNRANTPNSSVTELFESECFEYHVKINKYQVLSGCAHSSD